MTTVTAASTACVDPVANYHTAFPALQAVPWTNAASHRHPLSKKRQLIPTSISHPPLSPPKPPAYLKHTQYAALVREQYHYLLQKRYENAKKLMNDTQSPEHYTALRNNDTLAELDLRLPSFWNVADKSRYLEIDKNGLGVTYVGPGKCEDHAGTVRSNFPMRTQCGVYYFEMHVKSKGDDGYIGIGFCSAKNELKRLPGWDKKSFGYHGDDGHSFEGSGIGKKYGPQFKTGDVIGCGINFATKTAFYTKNGASLGTAFRDLDISLPLYPCVGMRTAGEYVTVNFGQDPFVYDITQYIQEQKLYLWKSIGNQPMPASPSFVGSIISKATNNADQSQQNNNNNKNNNNNNNNNNNSCDNNNNKNNKNNSSSKDNVPSSMDKLILSYLIHHGYAGSAQALTRDSLYLSEDSSPKQTSCQKDTKDVLYDKHDDQLCQRLAVKAAIMQGDIDQAIDLLTTNFPSVLKEDNDDTYILFELKCQKFVEMISNHNDKEYGRQPSKQRLHQRRCSEVDSMVSLSSEDDHMSLLSSSQTSSQDYFDNLLHHHDGPDPLHDRQQQQEQRSSQTYYPLTTHINESADKVNGKWSCTATEDMITPTATASTSSSFSTHSSTSWRPLTSSNRSRTISGNLHHGQSPPITTASPAPGRRTSWAAIVAAPASPTTTATNNLMMDISIDATRRPSLRRSSCSSNSYSTCSGMSGILSGSHHGTTLAEQDELLDTEGMEMDDGLSVSSTQHLMQSIMVYGQQLQDTYGKDSSPKVKDKLKQIFSLLAYTDPRSSPMGHLMEKSQREGLASEVNVAILVCQNEPEIPPLDRIYRQVMTVNKELACLGHGESVLLDVTQGYLQEQQHQLMENAT